MLIRRAKRGDIPQISRLYYETVHRVNARDYTAEQIHAWASRIYPDAFWQRRIRRYTVFVAEDEEAVVGFAEYSPTGAIDCFCVHHAQQHRGIGATLMARIERGARSRGNARLYADVSITAEPFFRRLGFRVVRRQTTFYRKRTFKQAVMEKQLRRLGPVWARTRRIPCSSRDAVSETNRIDRDRCCRLPCPVIAVSGRWPCGSVSDSSAYRRPIFQANQQIVTGALAPQSILEQSGDGQGESLQDALAF